jgi:hypothetical protein
LEIIKKNKLIQEKRDLINDKVNEAKEFAANIDKRLD